LFSCSSDRSVKIWTLGGALIATILFPRALTCLAVNSLETVIFCGDIDGNIYRVDLYEQSNTTMSFEDKEKIMRKHTASVTQLRFSFDESLLISSSLDSTCIIWDPHTMQCLRTFSQHSGIKF
jgi:pre-rRNA-processing protein IPI3